MMTLFREAINESLPALEILEEQVLQQAKLGDETAKHNLLRQYSHLVLSIARRHCRFGAFMEMEDLVQQGCMGLLRAIDKFDCDHFVKGKRVRFSTYATYWIEHSIRRSIQNHGRTVAIPLSVQRDAQALKRAHSERLGQTQSFDGNACFKADLVLSERRRASLHTASLQIMPVEIVGEDKTSYENVSPMSSADDSECLAAENETRRHVQDLLAGLTEKERILVKELFGLGEGVLPMSTAVVGLRMGISPQRVRQLRTKAINKLKDLNAQKWERSE